MTVRGRNAKNDPADLRKTSLDKDLLRITRVEYAARFLGRELFGPGFAVLFLAIAGILASLQIGVQPAASLVVVAAILGGYMALNIGANDVANNVAPAVGARALTLSGALLIAAVFEASGALIAGGDVVNTISRNIIDPAAVPDSGTFVWAMIAALLSSALWVNLATYLGAPVSTTHAVVGGVAGAGIAALGLSVINWPVIWAIAASWVISPLMGGVIAALLLGFIKHNIIYRKDKIAAARRWVPVLLALMATSFACYLLIKGFNKVWRVDVVTVAAAGLGVYAAAYLALKPWVRARAEGMENRNQSLRQLFHLPLICSAALLSFAHGANDVANAVGPLAAIMQTAQSGAVAARVGIPFWVMLIGAAGISLGLFLYGPKLIRMVGQQITKMNPMRAFCVALSAAITVIVASWFGLPVSSTHIAVGAVFGVGFFREYYTTHSKRRRAYVEARANGGNGRSAPPDPSELRRRKLVRRSHFMVIVAAWLITVPSAALIAAGLYLLVRALV